MHKLLTGRQDFTGLRSRGGLAGYPQRSESPHDVVESSHASSSLSWADGVSRALTRTGRKDRHVIAVVGDGALTGGMTWEALNNISDDNDRNLVIIVNDNGRSYAPTIGGMARYLNRVRTADSYRTLHRSSDSFFGKLGPAARAFYRGVRGGTHGFLSRFTNNAALYSNLDIKYLGPVDGHDLPIAHGDAPSSRRTSAPPSSCTRSPRRAAAISRPATTRPISSTPSVASIRHPGEPVGGSSLDRVDRRLRRRAASRWGRSAPRSSASPRRCSGRPGCCRSRSGSPTACTTSASPSSTPSPRRPASRTAACTRSSRSTRRS